jgi:hypothetical protein
MPAGHREKSDGGQRSQRRGDEEDPEAGGHSLAAAEVEPGREHVAQHGAERGQRLGIADWESGGKLRGHGRAQPDGEAALEHVEQKCGRAQLFTPGANHVGGADVAAAQVADVLLVEDAHQQVAGGHRAEQKRGNRNEQQGKRHNV